VVGRTLIIIGLAIAAVGLLRPYLTRLGLMSFRKSDFPLIRAAST
jgi:hypothetical protein